MAIEEFSGALPDGTRTDDLARYAREWREASALFCRVLDPDGQAGWFPVGYEPGLLLGLSMGRTIDVDPRLVMALLPILRAHAAGGN